MLEGHDVSSRRRPLSQDCIVLYLFDNNVVKDISLYLGSPFLSISFNGDSEGQKDSCLFSIPTFE